MADILHLGEKDRKIKGSFDSLFRIPIFRILIGGDWDRVSPCFLLAYFSILAVVLGLTFSFFRIFAVAGGFFLIVYAVLLAAWLGKNYN